jgi:hypothetical protein
LCSLIHHAIVLMFAKACSRTDLPFARGNAIEWHDKVQKNCNGQTNEKKLAVQSCMILNSPLNVV